METIPMKTKALFASLTLLCVVASGLAQTQPQGQPPPMPRAPDQSQDKDDVVRITTNLVQIDAIVTKDGKLVSDLKAEDFEIFEDGKKQTITSFSYISNVPSTKTTGVTAADRFSGSVRQVNQQMNALMNARSRVLFDRRAGGEMMARQTGGYQVRNSNDFKFERILEEQSGYYLIGYRPTDETFNKKFHRITAKVKRSGTTLRTRYGFHGYSEDDVVKKPQSRTNLALMSPFGAQDINIEFTAFFANDKSAGSVIRSFLYLNANDLTFVKTNDKHEANIELHGVIFGDNGIIAEQIKYTGVFSLPDKDYARALREGMRIRFDMPAKRPGGYQMRVAARDVASSRIGSAGQFVAVPTKSKEQAARRFRHRSARRPTRPLAISHE